MSESATKEFTRSPSQFTDRILDSAIVDTRWPVEVGRYRLVVSLACPWASRAVIVRRLLAREPGYQGGISVPAIVDVPSGHLVSNDYPQITLDLATQWRRFQREGAPDLYPEALREEIDAVNEDVFRDINNGVYRAGFAKSQESYEDAYTRLFHRLDVLSERLEHSRYLVGDTITESDIRLFATLVRFDSVYHGHFKCNRNKLTEMPVLWAYARDLFQTPGIGDTVDFDHIKRHYYVVHGDINPTRIVPSGPDLSGWTTPHGRESLGGRPFGDGTPPGPPPAGEFFPRPFPV